MAEPRPARGFQLVEDLPDENENQTDGSKKPSSIAEAGTNLLLLGLATLGRRTLVAIDNLFCLITVASAFLLWHGIPEPNVLQVVALTIYAAFVIVINWIVRR